HASKWPSSHITLMRRDCRSTVMIMLQRFGFHSSPISGLSRYSQKNCRQAFGRVSYILQPTPVVQFGHSCIRALEISCTAASLQQSVQALQERPGANVCVIGELN